MLTRSLLAIVSAFLVDARVTPKPLLQAADTDTSNSCGGVNTQYLLEINRTAPSSAVNVPANFFGFGFETAFLTHFSNSFSENLVKSIQDRMSQPLIIRVGGTSGDLVTINEKQTEPALCFTGHGCQHSSRSAFTLGPSYFDGFKSFPNSQMTFQAPIYPKLELKDWVNRSLDYVQRASEALGKDRIAAIALGNEPDFYHYSAKDYIARALELENVIIEKLGQTGKARRIFQLGEIPNEALPGHHEGGIHKEEKHEGVKHGKPREWFGILDLLADNLDSNGLGKFAAQHYYQIQDNDLDPTVENMQRLLMNHAAITEHFPVITQGVEYTETHDKEMTYVISEAGSSTGALPVYFAGGFGAALWAVDFHLHAMTRGINRISNTMRPEATHGFWVPDDSGKPLTLGPAVHGIFPSAAFVTDFIGKDSLGKVAVVDVPGNPDYFSAYAMYDCQTGNIKRVALVNLNAWSNTSGVDRGNATVTLHVGDELKSGTLERLHAKNGATAVGFDLGGVDDNATWAGTQWTYKVDQGKGHQPHAVKEETISVDKAGKMEVIVPNSEAVIVTFE